VEASVENLGRFYSYPVESGIMKKIVALAADGLAILYNDEDGE
jgi:hypothetical protein